MDSEFFRVFIGGIEKQTCYLDIVVFLEIFFSPLQVTGLSLYPLKTEKQRFSDVFRV